LVSVNDVKVKLLLLLSLLGILLVISAPFVTSVFVNLMSSSATSSTTTVFVDPLNLINETLQAGSKFTVHVNVSDVNDLFTWQVNMSWDSSILNVSRIIPGEFLARADNQTSSEALGGVVINSTDNAQGCGLFAESILGDVAGISGDGTLISIEFLVVGSGWTDLNIIVSGTMPTMLLDSADGTITYDKIDGYFSNQFLGDMDGDGDVDSFDFYIFSGAYGTSVGDPVYNPEADLDGDGDVDSYDFYIFSGNYGKSI
jgi:hypothetical protein